MYMHHHTVCSNLATETEVLLQVFLPLFFRWPTSLHRSVSPHYYCMQYLSVFSTINWTRTWTKGSLTWACDLPMLSIHMAARHSDSESAQLFWCRKKKIKSRVRMCTWYSWDTCVIHSSTQKDISSLQKAALTSGLWSVEEVSESNDSCKGK